MKVVIF